MVYSIIIVNWNSGDRLRECIKAINDSQFDVNQLQVIIIDNHSTDDSLEELDHNFVKIIRNSENIGFGRACNQGILISTGEYILLLNPDTKVKPNTLMESYSFMGNHPEITVMGCKHLNEYNIVKGSCARFPNPHNFVYDSFGLSKVFPSVFTPATVMTDWDHSDSKRVDQVIGAFMMIRRSFLDLVGLFDEQFFVYFEEMDLSLRIKQHNGIIYYNADIEIFHEGEGTTKQVLPLRLYYSLSSRLKYCKKHFSRMGYYAVLICTLLVEPITRYIYCIVHLDFKGAKSVLKGYRILYKNFQK